MEEAKYNVDVQIEIPLGSNIKYEYDHEHNKLIVDRILATPVTYFFNYGYIPNTLGGDNDPLDAIILCKEAFLPSCYVNCKIIGVLHTTDEKGVDDKIILVPSNKVTAESKQYNNITDISQYTLQKLKCFFEDYKKLEIGKFVTVGNFGDKDDAYITYTIAINNFVRSKTK